MDQAAVQAEYERLGYDRGWAFAMTPIAWLPKAKTVLVGLNPGGAEGEHDNTDCYWDSQDGNAYFTGRWVPGTDALYPIQVQVIRLHELLELGPEDVFAAQFIPFRSRSLAELPKFNEALAFSRELWRWTIAQSPADLFICMGNFAAWHMSDLLGAKLEMEWPSGWGNTRVRRYVSPTGKVVAEVPHLSRYQLLSMWDPKKAETARQAILAVTARVGARAETSQT